MPGTGEKVGGARWRNENRPYDRRRRMEGQGRGQGIGNGASRVGVGMFDNGPDLSEMGQDEVDEFVAKALSHPAEYGEMVLGADIYPKQREILDALLRYERVAIAGCNSSGKTFSMTPYSLWKLTVLDEMGILQIAPTGAQSRGVYWRDMRRMYRGSRLAQRLLGDTEMHNLSIEVTDSRYAQAITPGDVMSVRGFHAPDLLFILDEGNGIEASFFTAIDGTTASGVIQIAQLGNPTENSGLFFDCFDQPDLGWHCMNISAFDSVNLRTLEVPDWFDEVSEAPGDIEESDRRKLAYLAYLRRRYLAQRDRTPPDQIPEYRILRDDVSIHQTRREFVANMEANYAKQAHPSWFGQVLGVFPNESESQFFARAWLDRARSPLDEPTVYRPEAGPLVWGHDPNGMGQDEYALVGVQIMNDSLQHRKVFEEGFLGESSFDDAVRFMRPYMGNTAWINIDRMGAGERPAIELKRWAYEFGVPVYSVVSQQASTNPLSFKDLKAQMYCYTRDILEASMMTGLDTPELRQQMLSIRYQLTPRGQVEMESKRDMRKRGVKSPDRCDALVYAIFPIGYMTPWHAFLGV